ncbi:MAG: FAD-linked oxidase C-terminal domain-containing protein [Pseudomonadota bacterium]
MIDPDIKKELVQVVGDARYLDHDEELTCFAYDAYVVEALPEAVIFPVCTREVSQVMKIAARAKIPVTARGAGTSVCGAPVPVKKGIVLCFTKMDKILEVNPRDRYVIVQPGVINGDLQKALAPHGFFYPPDPGSMSVSTIGGNVAQNAGGPRCLKYGVTVDYILGMEVVLASGKVVRFGSRNVKDVVGYKLSSLFCGSEGTLGLVTEIILRVIPVPESVRTIMATFDDLNNTARAVSDIIGAGILPAAMELMDKLTMNAIEDRMNSGFSRSAEGTLLIEIDGVSEACEKEMGRIIDKVKANGATSIREAKSDEERQELWTARRSAYGTYAKLAPDIVSEDITVPASCVPEMIRKVIEIAGSHDLRVGVVAHAGDGNIHPMIPGDRSNKQEWARVEAAFADMVRAAVELGGTLSGEHGVGLAKSSLLPLVMNRDSLEFLSVIKRAVDPDGLLNPGKFV